MNMISVNVAKQRGKRLVVSQPVAVTFHLSSLALLGGMITYSLHTRSAEFRTGNDNTRSARSYRRRQIHSNEAGN